MTKDMSLTIQGIAVATLMLLVKAFELDFDEGQVTEVVSTILLVLGGILTYVGRVRKGDITWYGKRR